MKFLDELIREPFFPYLFALLLVAPIVLLMRRFMMEYVSLKTQELKLLTVKGNSENKSQAYERMMLYLDRIKPANLVTKFDRNLAPHEFLFLSEKAINEEFEYNKSQQIYITKNTWSNIVESKNLVIKILQETYENTPENDSLEDFKTVFLMNYLKEEEDFVSATMDQLRREMLMVT